MITWLVAAVCVLANVVAIAAFVLGRKSPKFGSYAIPVFVAAGVTPVVGILGTVLGLRQAFAAVSTVDASQKAALLSAGISEAMNATAFGIVACLVPLALAIAVLVRGKPKQ